MKFRDLAPEICRQRLIIEGESHQPLLREEMHNFLVELSHDLDMEPFYGPVSSYSPEYGWCAFMHWVTSGVHMYFWEDRNPCFFSIDIYTCKPFDEEDAVNCVRKFFGSRLVDVVWKE